MTKPIGRNLKDGFVKSLPKQEKFKILVQKMKQFLVVR